MKLVLKKIYVRIRRKKIFAFTIYHSNFGCGISIQFILEKKKTTRIWGYRNDKKIESRKFRLQNGA